MKKGMREFRQYRRKQIAELRPYQPGEDIGGVSISEADKEAGSPKAGDMIARNPKNRADKWLVAAKYFGDSLEGVCDGGRPHTTGAPAGVTHTPQHAADIEQLFKNSTELLPSD